MQKTKNEIVPHYESHWDTQNQMRLENYRQCATQCATQWASQNHMKRAIVAIVKKDERVILKVALSCLNWCQKLCTHNFFLIATKNLPTQNWFKFRDQVMILWLRKRKKWEPNQLWPTAAVIPVFIMGHPVIRKWGD